MLLVLTQMKGKREFPPDISASGDVLSHLSESRTLLFSLLLNIYTVSQKKARHYNIVHNFSKC